MVTRISNKRIIVQVLDLDLVLCSHEMSINAEATDLWLSKEVAHQAQFGLDDIAVGVLREA